MNNRQKVGSTESCFSICASIADYSRHSFYGKNILFQAYFVPFHQLILNYKQDLFPISGNTRISQFLFPIPISESIQ
jgi:hypothetical protein